MKIYRVDTAFLGRFVRQNYFVRLTDAKAFLEKSKMKKQYWCSTLLVGNTAQVGKEGFGFQIVQTHYWNQND